MMAISSTTHILRVLGHSTPNPEINERPVDANDLTDDVSEKQLQLTPSPGPSMADMLADCLRPQKGQGNTPLK